MLKLRFAMILCSALLVSCGQIVSSIMEESARNADLQNSAYEKPEIQTLDTVTLIDTRITGTDTAMLLRGYTASGKKYYESWQLRGRLHGVATYFYPSGKISHALRYQHDRPDALISCFDRNGKVLDGGTLKDGKGSLIIYHPYTQKVIYRCHYKNGMQNGIYTAYFADGSLGAEMVLRNDSLAGAYVRYYRSGKVHTKGRMDMRTGIGSFDTFYPNGKIQKREDHGNGGSYSYVQYEANGMIAAEGTATAEGQSDTRYFYGSEGRLLSKEQTLEGKRHGTNDYFYDTGAKKSRETFRNDTLQSDSIWHPNGKLSAVSRYKDGRKEGICQEYYPTGVLRVEQMYRNGVQEGMYKSYFASGKIYNEGQFKNGALSGDLKFYSERGQLVQTKHYNN